MNSHTPTHTAPRIYTGVRLNFRHPSAPACQQAGSLAGNATHQAPDWRVSEPTTLFIDSPPDSAGNDESRRHQFLRRLGMVRWFCLAGMTLPLNTGFAEEYLARVIKVDAGNRLEVMKGETRQHIRLFGVECPPGAKGDASRQFMRELTEARTVYIVPIRPDREGSVIAKVQFIGGVNVGDELIRAGLGTWDKKRAPRARRLKQLEREARASRRGLWAATLAMTNPERRTTPR